MDLMTNQEKHDLDKTQLDSEIKVTQDTQNEPNRIANKTKIKMHQRINKHRNINHHYMDLMTNQEKHDLDKTQLDSEIKMTQDT